MLSEKRLADGLKEDKVWPVSADNPTADETDSDAVPAEAQVKSGAWSSSDGGLTSACELAVSFSGGLVAEENHLRVAGMGTGTVSSTLVTSGLGGVGGMTFITGGCGFSRIGGGSF